MISHINKPILDWSLKSFRENPYPLYKTLRDIAPDLYCEKDNAWYLTGYDEVKAWLTNARLNQGKQLQDQNMLTWEAYKKSCASPLSLKQYAKSYFYNYSFHALALPEHSEIKNVYKRYFDTQAITGLTAFMNEETNRLISVAEKKGTIDLISEYAFPLTIKTLCQILGVSYSNIPHFNQWVECYHKADDLPSSKLAKLKAEMAFMGLAEYLDKLFTKKTRELEGGLIDYLVEGVANQTIEYPQAMGNAMAMIISGYRNAQHALGMGMYYLLSNQEQKQKLVNHPELINQAVEELFRIESPLQCYHAKADSIQIKSSSIRDDQKVFAFIGAANRDPKYFDCPDRLNIERTNKPHLSFSVGYHYCIGKHLARMQMRIAIETLLKRYPNTTISNKTLDSTYVLRGFKHINACLA